MVAFKDLTTFKTGGNIKHYFEVSSKEELVSKISFAKKNNLPIFVLGGGSDIVVSDKDFPGVVIKYTGNKVELKDGVITAEAGLMWDKLVEFAVKNNLQGIECLSAIPGTVGAAPIQNIGAYGQELKETFISLTAYSIEQEKFVTFLKKDCKFGYRDSVFKNPKYWQKYVITDVALKLNKNGRPKVIYDSLKNYLSSDVDHSLGEVRDAVIKVRSEKLENWQDMPNAGSFFKNPIIDEVKKSQLESSYPEVKVYPYEDSFTGSGKFKVFAGWLVEKAGWKGRSLGPVKVSDKHALILTNPKGLGTTKDILNLASAIQKDVKGKFGIELTPEVQYIEL